jgi:ABC-type sugar transport system permease subunit
MASTSYGKVRTIAVIIMIMGAIFTVAGVVTWFAVRSQLAAENITVSDDAQYFSGDKVEGPFTAYAQANVINEHALAATGGKTYAELAQDDPKRQTAMTASFLRASLYTSVVAFGVAALAVVLGILLILLGWALKALAGVPREPAGPVTVS